MNRPLPSRAWCCSLLAVSVAALAACATAPPRDATPPLPSSFTTHGANVTATAPVPAFWESFNDPALAPLVRAAWQNNQDLAATLARLRESRGLRNEQRYDFAPTGRASAGRSDQQTALVDAPTLSASARERTVWQAGFDARWELDLFGRLRGTAHARSADLRGVGADLDALHVAVAAEVARTWFDWRGTLQRLEVAKHNAALQADTLKLVEERLASGRGSGLDVARARAQWSTTRASVPLLELQARRAQLRLAVLLGESSDSPTLAALPATSLLVGQLATPPTLIATGDPTSWLRRRPDIRAAEARLEAAAHRQGVAVADLFPVVSFGGVFAWRAGTRDGLGDAASDSYQWGPSLTWPALDLPRLLTRLGQSRARAAGALAAYRQTVLLALEETEGALTAFDRLGVRQQDLDDAAAASAEATRLAQLRFSEGYSDFLGVLEAQRTQLEAEDRATLGRIEALGAAVASYKALGAGWEVAATAPYAPAVKP